MVSVCERHRPRSESTLRSDDAKSRLVYIEKEFEQLKHDYYDLNLKQKELLKTCAALENENQSLTQTIDEKVQLNAKLRDDIAQQTDCQQTIESLQVRIDNYENAVSQYEEYRLKLENNLQKITQQRDTNKMDLRLTREMLTNKENDFNQLKMHMDQCEKTLKDRSMQYEGTIRELQDQLQHDIQEVKQSKLNDIQVRPAVILRALTD